MHWTHHHLDAWSSEHPFETQPRLAECEARGFWPWLGFWLRMSGCVCSQEARLLSADFVSGALGVPSLDAQGPSPGA